MIKFILILSILISSCQPAFASSLQNCRGKMFCIEFEEPERHLYIPAWSVAAGFIGATLLGVLLSEGNRPMGGVIGASGVAAGMLITIPMNPNDPIGVTHKK